MSLPLQSDVTALNLISRGSAFLVVPAKDAVNTQSLDFISRAIPSVGNDDFSGGGVVLLVKDIIGMGLIPFAR